MKKLLFALIIVGLIFAGTPAFSFDVSQGDLGTGAIAGGGAVDFDTKTTHWILGGNGGAFGVSGAGGVAGAQAFGKVLWGDASANLYATGGGLTQTDAYNVYFPKGFLSIGVGSSSSNEAVAGAGSQIAAKAFIGGVETTIGGAAGQGTLNGSYMTEPIWGFSSEGKTFGIAGQGSVGAFAGGALAPTLFWFGTDAEIGATIHMLGASGSESYRYAEYLGDGAWKEGFRTDVMAQTLVETDGTDSGLAFVEGGFVAGGGAKTVTVQTNNYGGAAAFATGHYSGSGQLGDNYSGHAIGYSETSSIQVKGMKGSINSAAAGMSVSSN